MILYRYIIKEHIFPFLASLSIIVFLFTMQQAVVLLDRIVSRGIEPMVVLEVFLIQLAWILALGIPMAILSATLMTFGRMSGDVEITAIKASGRNMSTLLVPVFSAASVIMIALIFFHDLVLPEANHHAANLIGDISRKRPAAFIEPGILIRDFTGYTLYVDDVNAQTGDLGGIRIFSNAASQDPSVTIAAGGNIQMTKDQRYLELILYNGETHSVSRKDNKQYFLARFKKQVIYIENVDTEFRRTNSNYRSDREKNIAMMMQDVKDLRKSNKTILSEHNLFIDSLSHFIAHIDTLSPSSRARDSVGSPSTFKKWSTDFISVADEAVKKAKRNESSVERVIRRKKANDQVIAQYLVEVHKKYAIPAACLIFVLIGAPLGIMAKRGGIAVGASYSVFFFIAYWGFLITGENMADKLKISPAVGMWTGNVVIAICGVVLLILMLRETTIQFNFIKDLVGKSRKRFSFISSSFIFRLPRIIFSLPRLILNKIIGTLPTYLIGMFIGYAVGLTIAILIIFVTVDYISNLKRFDQMNFIQVAHYYYYYLPWLIQTILPVVLLLSSMFSIGRLSKTSEIIAMKAAGVNVRQLTSPLLVLGIVMSVLTFYVGEKIIPKSNELRRELMDSAKRPPGVNLPPSPKGIREYRRDFYYFGTPNVLYVFEEFSTSPQFARNVRRYTFKTDGMTERIEARDMHYDSTGWKFENGMKRTFGEDASAVSTFNNLNDTILKVPPAELVKRVKVKEEMSYWELADYIETAQRRGEQVDKYLAELEFKIALPFMNFIVILLGIAITARAGRKGGAALFGISLFMTFFFWLISRFALVFAQNGHIPTTVGAWIGNAIFLFIGLVLYRKAAH